jgi:hypothetical protein
MTASDSTSPNYRKGIDELLGRDGRRSSEQIGLALFWPATRAKFRPLPCRFPLAILPRYSMPIPRYAQGVINNKRNSTCQYFDSEFYGRFDAYSSKIHKTAFYPGCLNPMSADSDCQIYASGHQLPHQYVDWLSVVEDRQLQST